MTQKKDYKFSAGVKQKVFKLAGGRCAFKDCAKHLTSTKNNCQIAHIYPASNEGPRSKFIKEHGIEGNFRESEENGILMCPTHADLIDKDDGEGYPPEILFDWKKVIELTNVLIAHNPKIQRYEQQISVPNIISVVREEYDASKKNRAIDLNKAIEEKLNHLYNGRIANEHKISELECKPKALSSQVKHLISVKKETQRLNNALNQLATNPLFEIIKNLPAAQATIKSIPKDSIEETPIFMTNEPLNLTISLNGKFFKFSDINYKALFTIKSLDGFIIMPSLPFLDVHLTIIHSKFEKVECEITKNPRLEKRLEDTHCFHKPYQDALKTFCDMFESLQQTQKPLTAALTLEFENSNATTTFITNIHSSIGAPDQFLKTAKEILHCTEKGYSRHFNNDICARLFDGRLTTEEFRQIYSFFYRNPDHNDETQFNFKNYNCIINKSIRAFYRSHRLQVKEISSEGSNGSNTESTKPTLLIEI